MLTDCYEKGHTPDTLVHPRRCSKCEAFLFRVTISAAGESHVIWHTQAELDRLWKGVDREAARILGGDGQ